MNDSILIARAGNELGTWNAAEVRRMLESGVLMPGDNYWTTGMAKWDTLDRFVSIEPAAPMTCPIRFGSAWAVDKLGFTRPAPSLSAPLVLRSADPGSGRQSFG